MQDQLEVMDELRLEIAAADEGPEKEELERTLVVCRDLAYALCEGFMGCEEDDEGEIRFFPTGDCYHAEPIGA